MLVYDRSISDCECIFRSYLCMYHSLHVHRWWSLSPRKLTDSIGLPFNNVPSSIKQHLGRNIIARTFLPHWSLQLHWTCHEDLPLPLNRTTIVTAYSLARRGMISSSDHAYIASKQIVLAHISRLICIYALIYAVHTWFSPLYMLLCHRFPCFAVSSSSRSFHTSILGNNTLTSVPLAPRARRGLYPRDRDCLISKHRAATRVSKNEITEWESTINKRVEGSTQWLLHWSPCRFDRSTWGGTSSCIHTRRRARILHILRVYTLWYSAAPCVETSRALVNARLQRLLRLSLLRASSSRRRRRRRIGHLGPEMCGSLARGPLTPHRRPAHRHFFCVTI